MMICNLQIQHVFCVRSCICDLTIAEIHKSSCQKLSKGAQEILMRHQNIVKSDKLLRDTKNMLIDKNAQELII